MTRRAVLGLLVCLLLASCTFIPKLNLPDAPVSARYPSGGKTSAASSEIAWRKVLNDSRLVRLIDIALANNRDLRVAMLRVEEARAQYRIERSALLPSVSQGSDLSRSHQSGTTSNQWQLNLGKTSYELDLFGRIRSLSAKALEQYLGKTEAQRAAQVTLVAELATQYYTVRQFDELIAKANLIAYHRQRDQAENGLVLMLGQPMPTNLPSGKSLADASVKAVSAGVPSELLQSRPDIIEAERTLRAANADIGAARAAFFPSIKLTAQEGTVSTELTSLFSKGTAAWSFAPQITLPIFTGGRNRANLDAAKIRTRIEVANYEKAIQSAFREVADALTAQRAARERISTLQALVTVQQRRYDLASARDQRGVSSYLNVVASQQDLFSAQQNLIGARYDSVAARIKLYQAVGGGWK